jgi:hypothetical protein
MKIANVLRGSLVATGAAIALLVAGQANAQTVAIPHACWFGPKQPVCGERAKTKLTYANSHCAILDGAKVVAQGACKPAKAAKKAGKAKPKVAKPAGKKKG